MVEERVEIATGKGPVAAAMRAMDASRAIAVVAHGAGVGMDHPLMVGFADGLEASGMASLRFNFPYMEQGRRAPDREDVLRESYRAAYEVAGERLPGKQRFAGGKSMGGRIASILVAEGMPADGLIFIGYPMHPPGKPDRRKTDHLSKIKARMLFLQGTRDPFARPEVVEEVIASLRPWARLHAVQGGNHSCVVPGTSELETGRLLGGRAARFIQAADR
jgi:uncharacterized protein